MKIRIAEFAVVTAVLACVNVVVHQGKPEGFAALAVLFAFIHAQVSDREEERRSKRMPLEPTSSEWLPRLAASIQLMWVCYCLAHRSYTPAVGCAMLMLYPAWRAFYRRRSSAQGT